MKKLLFTKKVDKSLLEAGLTLPVEQCDAVLNAVGAVLGKGSHATIHVQIDNIAYPATLTHVNLSTSERDIYQIRYGAGSEICKKLNAKFKSSGASSCIEVWDNGDLSLSFVCIAHTIKEDFFKYLGAANSLAGYQRSYKLVFYKCFFSEEWYAEAMPAERLVKAFRQFYIDRVRFGLLPDKEVDAVIADPISSSPEDIRALIMRNPFNAIGGKGFFALKTVDGVECFCINPELYQALEEPDLEEIRGIVYKKLNLYYQTLRKD